MEIKKIEEWIEKYRVWVGSALLILILAGAGILLWGENYAKPRIESRILRLEERIEDLESKVQEAENNQTASNAPLVEQNSSDQAQQGQMASVNTSQNDGILKQVQDDKGTINDGAKIGGKININTASEAELDSLSGIGPTYAKRIVEYRNTNGEFKSIEDIKNVKGIGDKTFLKFKDNITVN